MTEDHGLGAFYPLVKLLVHRPDPLLHQLNTSPRFSSGCSSGMALVDLGKAASHHPIHHLAAVVITIGDGDSFYSQLARHAVDYEGERHIG